ncbi:PE family protein [Mycobacterium camsae]|uniref:PE family protein n=1 Tax=Mycobacterium gordonae TaxID=1778 RepID=UPI001980F1D4|nr:PE-PPE domain-containing protein [Mycobacterium gordonae]
MTSLMTQPQILATAAIDASAIGSVIDEATAAAACPTTNIAAAAADEVSTITAQFFAEFGEECQTLLQQAAAFHNQFVATLAAAGNAYATAEADIAEALGLTGGTQSEPLFGPVAKGAGNTNVVANLIMTGSGTATPSTAYLNGVYSRYLSGTYGGGGPFIGPLQAVTTAEGLYPFTGVKDLTLDISLARGVTALDNAINLAIRPGSTDSVSILGYSQSAIVASLEMQQLRAEGFTNGTGGTPVQAYFNLLGDPANPNGGLLSRFPGLSFPSLGVTFGAATPSNDYPTTIWTIEYDGFADFPRYPINILADLNALAGIVFLHGTYPYLTDAALSTAFQLPQSGAPSMTTYNMIPTENLPLLTPLRAIPLIGTPLADLVQPDLKALVNWGYGDPNYGFSTSPADVPTPFGFLPPLSATIALGPLLVSGTQQGVSDFFRDLSALSPQSLSELPLSSLINVLPEAATGGVALPAPGAIPSTINGVIAGLELANDNFVNTVTSDISTAYATLLPTADIGTALLLSLPAYDIKLFLNGISEVVNGNIIGGLLDAFGDPIAASVGLIALGIGFEFVTLDNAFETIVFGVPNPGPY